MQESTNEELSQMIHDSVWVKDDSEAHGYFLDLTKSLCNTKQSPLSILEIEEIKAGLPMDKSDVATFVNAIISFITTGRVQSNKTIHQLWMNARRCVDITVNEETFSSCNIMTVRLEENGFQGGDAGHGGFVKISITDDSCTNMYVNGVESHYFELEVRGDSERETLTMALEFALKALKENE